MSALELRVPPVALALVAAGCMWLVARWLPGFAIAVPWRVLVAAGCAVAGAVVALAGVVAFRKARTTVNPATPAASSTVVASGIYRRSRNPMYLGLLLVLAGWSLHLSHVLAMLFLPAFVLYMNRFEIVPEERALAAKFGARYDAYMRQVRRWI